MHRSINTRVMRVQYHALRVQLKHASDLWDSFFTFCQAQKDLQSQDRESG